MLDSSLSGSNDGSLRIFFGLIDGVTLDWSYDSVFEI